MFGKLYIGELKKIARPKTMIIIASVLVLILIVLAVIVNFLGKLMQNVSFDVSVEAEETQQEETQQEDISDFDKDFDFYEPVDYSSQIYIESEIARLEEEQAQLEKAVKEEDGGYYYTSTLYNTKAQLTLYRYIRDHQLYEEAEKILLGSDSILTAEGFAEFYMQLASTVLCIYGLVLGAGLLADEYKSGTVKMLFTRPVTHNQVIGAKLCALLTVALGFFLSSVLISYIYGVIAYSSVGTTTKYLVFNASSVVKSTTGAYLLGEILMNVINIVTYILCAFCVGTLTRKKTIGILAALASYIGIGSSLLGYTPISIACLSSNSNLLIYFSTTSTMPVYANFYISIAVYVVYVALFVVGLYIPFKKRDII